MSRSGIQRKLIDQRRKNNKQVRAQSVRVSNLFFFSCLLEIISLDIIENIHPIDDRHFSFMIIFDFSIVYTMVNNRKKNDNLIIIARILNSFRDKLRF